jgi:hypothetical protein
MSIEWEGRRSVKRSRWEWESHDSRNVEWRDTPQLREDAVMLVRRPKPLPNNPDVNPKSSTEDCKDDQKARLVEFC